MFEWIADLVGFDRKIEDRKHHIRLCAQAVSVARKGLVVALEREKTLQTKHLILSNQIDQVPATEEEKKDIDNSRLIQERTSLRAEQLTNSADLAKLRAAAETCEQRLQILKRAPQNVTGMDRTGSQIAAVVRATQAMAADAEAILQRLRSRQVEV